MWAETSTWRLQCEGDHRLYLTNSAMINHFVNVYFHKKILIGPNGPYVIFVA